MADLADATWTLRFDGSSIAVSSGARIVLFRDDGEAVSKSFKLDFPYSNNVAEYEAYLTGLAVAWEMGIKHLKVVGDSNLIICQARGEFSLKEPSLAPYRTLALLRLSMPKEMRTAIRTHLQLWGLKWPLKNRKLISPSTKK